MPRAIDWQRRGLTVLGACLAACAFGQTGPSVNPVDLAKQRIATYLSNLADVHCAESITQERLTAKGQVVETLRTRYDYLIMMQGNDTSFQLNESRAAASSHRDKTSAISMLISNGLPTLVLMFHPYYADSFRFEPGPVQVVAGKEVFPIQFQSIPGRRALAALAVRGREFPLELQGTVWVDGQSGNILKIDATLGENLNDIGLRSLKLHVDYQPVTISGNLTKVDLPAQAVVDVTTPRQHWRNTDVFSGYKSFSIDIKQGPAVNAHANKASSAPADKGKATSADAKENP